MNTPEENIEEFSIIDKAQKDFGENLDIAPHGLLYQYRSNDGFWAIIDSDAFWATNARFSNDREEQRMGIQKFMSVQTNPSNNVYQNINELYEIIEDCYILCFCKEGDILSQWRGYAEEGISVGYDFGNIRPFSISKKNDKNSKNKEFSTYYSTAYNVIYLSQKCSPTKVLKRCKLDEYVSTSSNFRDKNLNKKLKRFFPYLKHEGFVEEKECRIVFFNNGSFDEYIQYRTQDGIKIPYLIVKCGNHEKVLDEKVTARISFSEKMEPKEIEDFKNLISKVENTKLKIVYCGDKEERNDTICHGCTNRRLSESLYNDRGETVRNECTYNKSESNICEFTIPLENKIVLSECSLDLQKTTFNSIKSKVLDVWNNKNGKNKKMAMWCDGHLPIRKIIVGPCMNQREKQESIKHYCKKHYWLNYVKVKKSKIPYRGAVKKIL